MRFRPLSKLSMAESVGFEPTVLSHGSFQDYCLQPLGQLSIGAYWESRTPADGLQNRRHTVRPSRLVAPRGHNRSRGMAGVTRIELARNGFGVRRHALWPHSYGASDRI